jgi:hypothetical protein
MVRMRSEDKAYEHSQGDAYERPTLTVLGSVWELTLICTNKNFGPSDGAWSFQGQPAQWSC